MPGGDSVKLIQDDRFVKRIHSEIPGSGRLQRGSSTRLRNASIPSKFQTFVMPNSDNKGFNIQTKRFQYVPSEVPGPGAYSRDAESALVLNKPSHSKAGFGTMTSKAVRFPQRFAIEKFPAPNSYDTANDTMIKKDFNRSISSHQFHMPIAVVPKTHPLINREASKMPAPNQYDVAKADEMMFKAAGGASTQFKSKTQRSWDDSASKSNPGPAKYEVKDDIMKPEIDTSGASHCFISNSERLQIYDKKYKSPGPAAYNVREETEKSKATSLFPKKHFLCLSAPAIPPAPPGPSPGPGHYDLRAKETVVLPMSSAAFVSNTSRWQIGTIDEYTMPSPAQYNPQKLAKQSFLFNGRNNWVC